MFNRIRNLFFASALFFPIAIHASVIESTIGTAVVNDATAAFYNPAALILLKNPQIIGLGSVAFFHTQFRGSVTQGGLTQFGSASTGSHNYVPSLYFGTPVSDKICLGLAVVSNFFNRDLEQYSILRYVQSSNNVRDVDVVPAIGFQVNDYLSLGAGLSISYAKLVLKPVSGVASFNIPDAQSHNESSGVSWGGQIGLLLKPSKATLVGITYRSSSTYPLKGTSELEIVPPLIANNYHFKFRTPARSVLSLSHFVSKSLGFIATVQYIQWSIFKDVNLHNVATQIGSQAVIVPDAKVHFHLHNAWLLTLGTLYRFNPEWIIRLAGTYVQSPASGQYQLSNGDSVILGTSMGYKINKYLTLDGSYAHAFIKNQRIHIATSRAVIDGINRGWRDAISFKLTFNLC